MVAESLTCKFKSLSSCRETPSIQKNWQETCLFEILTDANLTLCRIKHEPENIFTQRIGQQWAISMKNKTKCHRVTQLDQEQHAITTDSEITIPPITLLTVDTSTTWSCDHFLLPGIASNTNELIRIIDNKKVNYDDSKLIDLYQTMSNDTRWKKIPHIPADIQSMFEYLLTTAPIPTSSTATWYQHGNNNGGDINWHYGSHFNNTVREINTQHEKNISLQIDCNVTNLKTFRYIVCKLHRRRNGFNLGEAQKFSNEGKMRSDKKGSNFYFHSPNFIETIFRDQLSLKFVQ